jgi:7-cyano-7-deazaguanine synthase
VQKKSKAVVLLSGGMDSLVTAAIASLNHTPAFLHVRYGQKTHFREFQAFNDIAGHYNVRERLVCNIDSLNQIGGSSLTDDSIEISAADPDSGIIPTSYVPFRNAHMLCIAVSWAEVIGAQHIYIGAVEEDSSGYPDCRRFFFDAFEKAIETGTKPETDIKIVTPVINLRKKDIVLKGLELNVPFELSWSCYRNSDKACGRCDSCALRLRAFNEAGIPDPIPYE